MLSRRSQAHQTTLAGHINVWDPETAERLKQWAAHFVTQGADSYTAERRALSTLYQEVTRQAQLLAFADDFWILFLLFCGSLVLLPMLQRVHIEPSKRSEEDGPPTIHAD
jgi:DHA2 family multidrug resistance protein